MISRLGKIWRKEKTNKTFFLTLSLSLSVFLSVSFILSSFFFFHSSFVFSFFFLFFIPSSLSIFFLFFWWWWSGQQRHMCPRIPRRTRPEISERCNSSKILISSKVDAFLHSSVLNLKKRLQCLHFQLFQTCDWKTSNVDYYSCSSAVPGKRCFKHIPQKGFSRWKLLCIMIPETVDNDVEDGAFHDDTKNIPQSEEGRLRQVKTVVCFSPNQPLFMCDSARNPFF